MYNEKKSFLSQRFEFKYVLDRETALRVEDYIQRIKLHPDSYSTRGYYCVNSLYFDTHTFLDYFEKDSSLCERKKLRARIYHENWLDPSLTNVNLEIKRKQNCVIHKTRIGLRNEDWQKLVSCRFSPLDISGVHIREQDKSAFEEFISSYITQGYRPYIVVTYARRAYITDFTSPIRITFDKDIRTCRARDIVKGPAMVPVTMSSVIMEVKFNGKLPWWFTRMIKEFDLSRTDFSKYLNAAKTINSLMRIPIHK